MLRRLVASFRDRVELPIEVEEIRDALVRLGVQDRIILSGEELDTGKLRGAFYQWREHSAPYSDPTWVTLVIYPVNETISWQRLICAKELVHLCDAATVRAADEAAVAALASKLVGPFEPANADNADVVALLDKLAQHLSVSLLFPRSARELAKQRIADGSASTEDIAAWAVLPAESIVPALDSKWDAIEELLVAIGNGERLENQEQA